MDGWRTDTEEIYSIYGVFGVGIVTPFYALYVQVYSHYVYTINSIFQFRLPCSSTILTWKRHLELKLLLYAGKNIAVTTRLRWKTPWPSGLKSNITLSAFCGYDDAIAFVLS